MITCGPKIDCRLVAETSVRAADGKLPHWCRHRLKTCAGTADVGASVCRSDALDTTSKGVRQPIAYKWIEELSLSVELGEGQPTLTLRLCSALDLIFSSLALKTTMPSVASSSALCRSFSSYSLSSSKWLGHQELSDWSVGLQHLTP
jgi:hypothetical protein